MTLIRGLGQLPVLSTQMYNFDFSIRKLCCENSNQGQSHSMGTDFFCTMPFDMDRLITPIPSKPHLLSINSFIHNVKAGRLPATATTSELVSPSPQPSLRPASVPPPPPPLPTPLGLTSPHLTSRGRISLSACAKSSASTSRRARVTQLTPSHRTAKTDPTRLRK